jgi:5'-nucleotidase
MNIRSLRKIFDKLLSLCSSDYVLNVNFPDGEEKGVVIAPLGIHLYTDEYISTGENTYQLVGAPTEFVENEYCDVAMIRKGYITVTPIIYDRTATKVVEKFKDFKF